MNAKDRLANWLATKKRDYKEGVQIFIDLNIDVDKIGFFSEKTPGNIHQNMLHRQLVNYARVNKVKPRKIAQQIETGGKSSKGKKKEATGTRTSELPRRQTNAGTNRVKVDTNPVVKYEELPEELKGKFNENGRLTNESRTLHAELKQIKGGNAPEKKDRRGEIAKLLVSNKKIVRENWETIDKWWTNKQTKTPEQLAAEGAIKKEKRITANLNYIRRYQGTTKEKQQKELAKRKKELDKWEIDYAKLVKKISKSSRDKK